MFSLPFFHSSRLFLILVLVPSCSQSKGPPILHPQGLHQPILRPRGLLQQTPHRRHQGEKACKIKLSFIPCLYIILAFLTLVLVPSRSSIERPTNPPPTSGGTRPLPPTQPGCVDCTNLRSPTMISRNSVCDSCNRCRPIECTQLNGFCEFTCFLSGYDIGKECCDYTQQLPDDGKDCQECTNIRTQRMVESGQQCATYQFGLLNRCARERPANPATGTPASRSWWLDAPVQYCQYSCWRANAGYQGKTLTGEMIVGEKKNQYPQTFDPRPCCPRSDATDPDIFPPPSPTLPLRSDGGSQDM